MFILFVKILSHIVSFFKFCSTFFDVFTLVYSFSDSARFGDISYSVVLL